VASTDNQASESRIAIVGSQPEALLLSTLFAEAGERTRLVGNFEGVETLKTDNSALGEARWLLGVHRKSGAIQALSAIESLATHPPSIFILTGHAVYQRELSELERTVRAVCKVFPCGATIVFTGLCRPNFSGTILKELIEKYSGHKVGKDVHLSYVPLYWGGETVQRFREKPKLVGEARREGPSTTQEIFLSIFPSVKTSSKISVVEAAGLFGPIYRDVVRALEFELASMCVADGVDYSEALDLGKEFGYEDLDIPRSFVARDAIASNIAISSTSRGRTSLVRAARKINETGEQKVLDMLKDALALCGRRFRNTRIAILGLNGLESYRDPKLSQPSIIRTLDKRGAILSVYPGRDNRWFQEGILSERIRLENTPLRAVSKTSCALVALDGADFGEISPQKLASEMSRPAAICDLSGVLEASNVEKVGLFYTSIGRGNSEV